ncbi:maleylpyruvate isomerase family mycothiol-dependent enzyme [Gordonia sinesedis]
MPTTIDGPAVTEALRAEWKTIAALGRDLDDAAWAAPSVLPAWSNADIIAHVIGTESMLAGRDVEAAADIADRPHVHNAVGEFNERWLDHFRGASRDDVLAALDEIIEVRSAALATMTTADFDAETMTPAGRDTYGRFMRIRVFDCWIHELDLRDATDGSAPSDALTARWAVDEISASLPFVVGKRAGAPSGTTVDFEVTGLAPRTIRVEVTDRARPVPVSPDTSADTTLRVDTLDLARLVGGRRTADPAAVEITGDEDLGRAIVDHLNYVI